MKLLTLEDRLKALDHPFFRLISETAEELGLACYIIGGWVRDLYLERPSNDIDIVVILDELSAADIQTYHDMLDTMSHRELICGFLSGKKEIMNWEPSDLFQFCHDTTPIKGSLDEVMTVVDRSAVNRAIKIGACNIYHGCVHNMLHEKSEDILRGLYKSASFVVQAIAFKQTGNYISHQKDLLQVVSSDERVIVETFLNLKNGGAVEFNLMSELLFAWSKKWIAEIS